MQIAKMIASLGFNVDTSGLDKFRQNIKLARTDITNMGRDAGTASTKLTGLSKALDGLSNKLDKVSVKKANDAITKSYENVSLSVSKVEKALKSIETNQKGITKALGKIHGSVKAGEPLWDKYRASVVATKEALKDVNGKMKELRANSTVSLKVNQGNGTSGSQRREQPNSSFFGGMMGGASGGIAGGFFRSMLPSVALGGGLGAAGYGLKEVVQRGRDQQRMENILMFATKDAKEFADALQYVRKESLRLGLDTAELGRAFAQVQMSAGDKLSMSDKKAMFKDMSEYIMTTGAGQEDQKLIFKAVNQMFSLGKMQAEEMNQLTERGIPREMIYRIAKETLGLKTNEQVQKAQKEGKLDPSIILPKLFKAFADKAHESGAFQKAMDSSQTKQNIATQEFNALAKQIMDGGLDKALANIFTALIDLTKVLSDIVEGFKAAKAAIDDLTNGNSALSIILTIVLALLFKKRTAVISLVKNFKNFSGIMRVITGFLNGGFGQAILKTIGRFGVWGVAITAVITLLQKVGEAMKRRASGEWTWIDTLIHKFDMAKESMKILWLDMQIFWNNLAIRTKNPSKWFTDFEFHSYTAGSTTPLQNTGIGNKNAGSATRAQRDIEAQKNREAIMKMQEAERKQGVPYASPQADIRQLQVPSLEKLFGNVTQNLIVTVDGVRERNVSVMSSIT